MKRLPTPTKPYRNGVFFSSLNRNSVLIIHSPFKSGKGSTGPSMVPICRITYFSFQALLRIKYVKLYCCILWVYSFLWTCITKWNWLIAVPAKIVNHLISEKTNENEEPRSHQLHNPPRGFLILSTLIRPNQTKSRRVRSVTHTYTQQPLTGR